MRGIRFSFENTAVDLQKTTLTEPKSPTIGKLPLDHSFVDALAAIIAAAAAGEPGMGSYFPKIKHWWVPIHITLVYPWTAAEIAFFNDDPGIFGRQDDLPLKVRRVLLAQSYT